MVGVAGKNDKYDFRVADAAVEGDVKAQARIKRYNVGDIRATEALYWALLPHIKPHPHVAPNRYMAGICCPRCASRDVHRSGSYTPGVLVYAMYRCGACSSNFKTTFESRGPSVRAL
jgi:DNA-directed RNA polymerase subunit RPC12/RpoP